MVSGFRSVAGIMKRVIWIAVIVLSIAGASQAGASQASADTCSLTLEQKLEDFEYLYKIVSENYPFLWVNERANGVDWMGEREEFRQLVADAESDTEFAQAIAHILSRLNNGHTHIMRSSASSTSAGTGSGRSNVTMSIIKEGQIAYIRIRSFSSQYIEQDRQLVLEFLASVSDYRNLLIDIRGNGGGSGAYWRQLLVAPLISDPVAWRWYLAVRSGEAVQDYMKNRLGAGYYFLQVGRGNLPGRQNVPREVFTEEFIEPIQLPDVVMPRDTVGFSGRIFLLVDEGVYSSSESFAAFAKTTGWATLVGSVTGGDGIGFDPMVFTLPNSQLNIRMSESMGLNPDGTANEEAKTIPDVLVDVDSEESPRDRVLETAVSLCLDMAEEADDGSGGRSLLSRLGWMWEIAGGFGDLDIGLAELAESADFSAYEGMEVESVEVYGAFDTDESMVRRTVGIGAGDRFSTDALDLARQRLRLTSSLRSTGLLVRPSGEGKVKVVVFIQEGWSLYLSPRDLGRRVIEDAVSGRISLSAYNIGGKMVNARAVYGFGPRPLWSLQVETPVFAGRLPLKLSMAVGAQPFAATLASGAHKGSSFAVQTSITSLSAQTALSGRSSLAIRLSGIAESVRELSSSTGLSMQDGEYMSLALILAGQTRRSVPASYEVTAGAIAGSGSGSTVTHGLATARSTAFLGLSEKNTLVLTGTIGAIDSSAPASRWFLLGGGDSFPEYSRSLLGHAYVSANAELRHYITGNLSVGATAGFGKVWDVTGDYCLQSPMARIGAVVRYTIPVSLVLEARYTKSITSGAERFYLGIRE